MQALSLNGNQNTGIIPSIAKLPNFERLYLWRNNFSGPFLDFITNASKLSKIDISFNSIAGFIPGTIEYGREEKVSRQGDVYNYGIMLMDTFTKKKPTNEMFIEEMSLRRWVGVSLCSTVVQVVDINLHTRDDEHFSSKEECVSSILSLAMECTRESPLERLTMKEVVTRLIKIEA
ncbi:putative receptor-like protein kinase At3g47110 [Mangifera indica]|uniref:putative receptor-like protein kinase At3g47110 n=1 Tax=Mangifera indica TaxID=29780 RepID=UPI001CF99935|nr:putative receptor-like protein kinase At3g47110 [Mangifera indica]